jgi:hypothetical protein
MRSEIGAQFFNADMTWRDRATADARRWLSDGGYERSRAQGEAAEVEDVLAWAQAPVGVAAAGANRSDPADLLSGGKKSKALLMEQGLERN